MGRGAWPATIYKVASSLTGLKQPSTQPQAQRLTRAANRHLFSLLYSNRHLSIGKATRQQAPGTPRACDDRSAHVRQGSG